MQRAQQGLLRPGLRCLATDQVCDNQFNLCVGGCWERRLEVGNVGNTSGSLGEDLFSLEVLDQWIKARVFRDDMKERGWVLARKRADVVRDMEVEGIGSSRFEDDVFRVAAKGLKSRCKRNGNLGLVGAEKDLDPEWAVLEQAEILRLDILEIDKDEVCSQSVLHVVGSEPHCGAD